MRVFCLSWPKAGTHVLLEVAKLLLGYGKWYEEDDLKYTRQGRNEFLATVDAKIDRYGDNFALKGHIPWSDELEAELLSRGFKLLFIVRDPRDVLCSTHRWLTDLRKNWAVSQYLAQYSTTIQLAKVIQGLPALHPFELDSGIFWDQPLPARYSLLTPWSQSSAVCLRYEELIGSEGLDRQISCVGNIQGHLGIEAVENVKRLALNIVNPNSKTFHSGKTGTWPEMFEDIHRKLFLAGGGESLVKRFGYKPTLANVG